MVLTLELPIRRNPIDPLTAYESRFGDLPAWLDEISPGEARSLAFLALRRGAPLAPADIFS
ncbi:hypothetical protein [Dechloromonas sp. A34]|uniref:hypothetical protein n=1 Tax=Dechloromonas sp. A34 TaxID=447588 RepID=UPI00224968F8|nr:hypothetical protein [Dechloromonas sp. A34]